MVVGLLFAELASHFATHFTHLCSLNGFARENVVAVVHNFFVGVLLAAYCYLDELIYQCAEIDVAVLPQVERQRAGDGVYLVNEYLVGRFVDDEVDARYSVAL